jgi:hypothetical protein
MFFDNGAPLSSGVLILGGAASYTTSSLSIGTHSITAEYSGDSAFNRATSASLSQTVKSPKVDSTVTLVLTSGANPSVYGSSLTFSANVTPVAATGTVVFFDGAAAISGNLPINAGAVTLSIPALGAGAHSITAQYSGDASFTSSMSPPLIQKVTKANTTSVLAIAEDDAFKIGAPVTFVLMVSPANAMGTVTFYDGPMPISTPTAVSNGGARFTTTALAVGTHLVSAQYSGDSNFNGSASSSVKLKVIAK